MMPELVKTTISLERYVLVLALVVKAEKLTGMKVLDSAERQDHTQFLTSRLSRAGDPPRLTGAETPNESYPWSLQEQIKPVQCRFSVDKYSARADPARNIPEGLCQGELACWRYTTVRHEFWFAKQSAGELCTYSASRVPDAEHVANALLLEETRDPEVSPAAARLMMAAAAHLNGQRWPPSRADSNTSGTFDFSTRNLVGSDLLAISSTGELAQFAFLDYEKKIECRRGTSGVSLNVACQPTLVAAGEQPAPSWRKVIDIKEVARLSNGWGAIAAAGSIYVDYDGGNSSHSIVAARNDGTLVWRTVALRKNAAAPASSTSTMCPPRNAGAVGGAQVRLTTPVSNIQARCMYRVAYLDGSIAPQAPTFTMSEQPLAAWGPYARIFSGGRGITYAIDARGDLYWIKDTRAFEAPNGRNKITRSSTPSNCVPQPASGNLIRRTCAQPLTISSATVLYNKIGEGWGSMRAVASSGRGMIYALGSDDILRLYQHTLFANDDKPYTASRWQPTRQLASKWTGVKSMAADMNGSLYVLKDTGELLYYKASDFMAGPVKLAAPVTVGGDWSTYRLLFALNNQLEREPIVR
jgi:hypothetical protein